MLVGSMEKPENNFFFVSWFGAIAGALFLNVMNPP